MNRILLSTIFSLILFTGFTQPCFVTTSNSFPLLNYSGSSIASDFNVDGKPDLAILQINGPGTSTISILLAVGNGTFAAAVDYTIGTPVSQIITGDFNNDGKTDIATSNKDVLLGNGAGSFSFATPSYTSTAGNTGIAATDFNNDGKTDIAITTTSQNKVWVYLGNGSGLYTSGSSYNVGTSPVSITANDFNSDGKIDLAIANLNSGDISILKNTGTSFAAAINYYVGPNLLRIASDDFNNDGNPDLAVANSTGYCFGRVWILFGSNTGTMTINSANTVIDHPNNLILSDLNNDGFKDIVTNNGSFSILMGSSNGTFSSAVYYQAPPGIASLSCDDFNGDGKIDIALGSNSIFIISGNGDGTFISPISYWQGNCQSPIATCSADFNNDSHLDLAIANSYNDIFLLLGSPSGTFTPTSSYTVGSNPRDIQSADFNSDGKMDIVVANSNSNNISILMGNGNGTLSSPINYSTSVQPYSLCINDFNGDTKMDIAVGINSQDIAILLNNGNGTFANPVNYFIGNYNPKIVSADFNVDGNIDLAVNTNNASNSITVLFGNGSGTFLTTASTTITTSLNTLITKDFNNDGKYDLAATDLSLYNAYVYINNGNGTFGPEVTYPSTLQFESLISSDLNGDGELDIAAGGDSGFSVFSGNGSGTFSSAINYSITNVTQVAADFNNDGKIDLAGVDNISYTTVLLNNGTPNFTLSGTNTVCIGSSTSINASGSGSFLWSNGASGNSITVLPNTTSVYTVTNQSANGCSNTKTISVIVNTACQDVWPGDSNSDGVADNLDVLELGLHYTQSGPARAIISNTWQSNFSNNWTGTITNGQNLNHSDCNGDGTIDDNDTLAIYNNYGLTHVFKPLQTNTVSPQLSVIPDQASVLKGTWGTASIYLGDNTTNINNINGVAFTVDFDNTLIETNSIYIEYQNSFIDAGQNLHFRKLDFANGKLYTASTHTINNNVNGFGKIATLHYQIKSNLTSAQVLNIGISQANKSDISGLITPLTAGTGSLTATIDVGIQEVLNDNNIFLSPNPTNGILNITSKTELQKIEIIYITGAVLLSEVTTSNNHTLHLENYSNGIYFVNVYQNNRIVRREKVIVNK